MSLPQLSGPIVVFDVETTGLFPSRHDRVVEIAAVVVSPEGQIEREFVSLVNPTRDIGPSSIHGPNSESILHAPQFGEIAALLLDVLHGTVAIAGHNIRFDRQFLEAEFIRMGESFPNCPSLCTMEMAWGGTLKKCCHDFGVPVEQESHHALADARAAARLLVALLADSSRSVRFHDLRPIPWPTPARTDKQPVTRADAQKREAEPPTFLQRLLQRSHDNTLPLTDDAALMAYGELLDRILEDRYIDSAEADALLETAAHWGLSGEKVRLAHEQYLRKLATVAVADGSVTAAERRDLALVARLLGQERPGLDELLKESFARRTQALSPPSQLAEATLSGKRVCFTGELQCHFEGKPISRQRAEELSTRAGLVIVDSVTQKLDLLVVADPHTQSGKAKKARQYNIRVMHEPVFWKAIGIDVQ